MPMQARAGDRLDALGDPFDALGDPNRRAIVRLLRDGDHSVGELADELPISRPAVSRHLRLLKDAGLVTARPEGTRRLYRLHGVGIEAVREYLEEMWGEAAVRFKLVAENTAPNPKGTAPRPENDVPHRAPPSRTRRKRSSG